MRRALSLSALLTALVSLSVVTPAEAQETTTAPPVGTETEYRDALVDLSADTNCPHTIVLSGNITLAAATDPLYTGTCDLTVDGNGFFLDGGLNSRVLTIRGATPADLTIEDITVRNGRDQGAGPREGGAVFSSGNDMTVRNALFTGNRAVSTDSSAVGGAIQHTGTGTMNIENTTFGSNRALATNAIGRGGAVASGVGTATSTVTDSGFTGNVADAPGSNADGGALSLGGQQITITGSTLASNKVTATGGASGGALRATTSSLAIRSTTIVDNSASGDDNAAGGGVSASALGGVGPRVVEIEDAVIADNTVQTDTNIAEGGGVRVNAMTTTMRRSVVAGNTARSAGLGSWGGGVSLFTSTMPLNTLTIVDSALDANQATGATTATQGGGIRAFVSSSDTVLTLVNSTVAANLANGSAGQGGGIWTKGASLDHATVASNQSTSGANYFSSTGVGDFARSAFADPLGSGDNCANPPLSQGFNADDDGSCLVSNLDDLPNQPDLLLGQARNNGDLVAAAESAAAPEAGGDGTVRPTMFPLNGSPLVDAIPPGSCSVAPELDLDQRGVDRPFGAGCDIGAIEAVFPAHGFTDVTPFYEATVRWITSPVNTPNILDGYDNGTFRQTLNITRGQVARMYYRAAGEPDLDSVPPHGFDDVTTFFEDAVRWAKDQGIFDGYDDNTFRQANPITRGNFTRSLYGFAQGDLLPDPGDHGFTDVTPFYEASVRWAKANGLADGFDDDTFRQANNITRGNATRITYNLARTKAAWGDTMSAPDNMLFRPNLAP